jgi:glycosyltransferase involved in cell wall biosynthesis
VSDEFKPLQEAYKTKKIREEIDADIIVGHFGRIANTTYPYLLLSVWEELISKYPRMKLVFGVNNGKVDTTCKNILHKTIKHEDMPYYISACDIVVVSQHGREWEVCGNLKVKEPAACGVPVILQRSLARIEEYGNDYPLFLPESYCDIPVSEEKRRCIIEKFDQIIDNFDFRKSISDRLINSMKFYSLEESGKRLEQTISQVILRK